MKYSVRDKEKGSFGFYREKIRKRDANMTCKQKAQTSSGVSQEPRLFRSSDGIKALAKETKPVAVPRELHTHGSHDP